MLPKIAVCVPVDFTEVEYRAVMECMANIGAKKIILFEDTLSKSINLIPSEYNVVIEIIPNCE